MTPLVKKSLLIGGIVLIVGMAGFKTWAALRPEPKGPVAGSSMEIGGPSPAAMRNAAQAEEARGGWKNEETSAGLGSAPNSAAVDPGVSGG